MTDQSKKKIFTKYTLNTKGVLMAYEAKGKEVVVDTIQLTNFTELRVTAIHDENDELTGVDLRNWFCKSSDPTIRPSQKGIRLRVEDIPEIIDVLSEVIKK